MLLMISFMSRTITMLNPVVHLNTFKGLILSNRNNNKIEDKQKQPCRRQDGSSRNVRFLVFVLVAKFEVI